MSQKSEVGDNVPSQAEQTDWLRRVANDSDISAFEQLFNFYAPRIKHYMMGKQMSEHEAEDLVQDALVTVWRKAETFKASHGAVSTWIFTIARNLRIDKMRRQHFLEVPGLDELIGNSNVADQEANVDAKQIREALHMLPQEICEVMHLAYIEGLTQNEIGNRLGIPLGTVKSRIRRGIEKLRSQVFNK